MTSRHSLYKSKNRLENATVEQKITSTFQIKINVLNKVIASLVLRLRADNYTLKMHGELFKKLIEENIVTKEYCKPYLPRKEDAIKIVKEKKDKL
jgi:hypothetical protein